MQAGNVICFVTQFIVKNQVVLRCEKRACAFSSAFKKRRRAKEPAWIINHEFRQIKTWKTLLITLEEEFMKRVGGNLFLFLY